MAFLEFAHPPAPYGSGQGLGLRAVVVGIILMFSNLHPLGCDQTGSGDGMEPRWEAPPNREGFSLHTPPHD